MAMGGCMLRRMRLPGCGEGINDQEEQLHGYSSTRLKYSDTSEKGLIALVCFLLQSVCHRPFWRGDLGVLCACAGHPRQVLS